MFVNGIRVASERALHDWWHLCVRRGADKTADAIAREMARRHLEAWSDRNAGEVA